MIYLKASLLLSFLILSNANASQWPFRSSFALTCWSKNPPYPFMPLNFFEFREEISDMTLKADYQNKLLLLAPKTFRNYKKRVALFKSLLFPLDYANYERYDSITLPPIGCGVITMIQESPDGPNQMLLDRATWQTISKETQEFYLFDYYLQFFLKPGLSHSAYRRFSLYAATGMLEKFSAKELKEFFSFYGIEN